MILVLNHIKSSSTFDAKAVFEAGALLDKWCVFETHLTAFLLLAMYGILQQASEYLQTKGLDYLSGWNMVQSAKGALMKVEFEEVLQNANAFVNNVNAVLLDDCLDVSVETELRQTRVAKKKVMFPEEAPDERPHDALIRFKVETFRRTIDEITVSINERFLANADLIKDTACFDPRNFLNLCEDGVPEKALEMVSRCTGLNAIELRHELSAFIRDFPVLCKTLHEHYKADKETTHMTVNKNYTENTDSDISKSDGESEQENDVSSNIQPVQNSHSNHCTGSCKRCLLCCYKILYRYCLNSSVYSNLFLAYEYLLTLSFSQVSCERVFSKLKIVKTRLRSSLTNDKLEAFLMMSVETDVLEEINVNDIIPCLASSSATFAKMFIL